MNTELICVNPNNIEEAAARAGRLLRDGEVVAFPTDTVYGLGAVYSDAEAVRKLFQAKGRPENKPLSILVADLSQTEMLAESISEEARALMQAYWPGALTLIFRKKAGAHIPEEVTAGGDTIGIRMPESEIARSVIRQAGSPLAAPSANLTGKRSGTNAEEVAEDLAGRIPLIIDGGRCPVGVSSTVADMTDGQIRILREGTVTRSMIERTAGRKTT